MRIGRRPDARHNAVILDLFDELNLGDDCAVLMHALQRDETIGTVLLQMEELGAINEYGVSLLKVLAQIFRRNGRRLVLVKPRGEILNCLAAQDGLEIVESEPAAFR